MFFRDFFFLIYEFSGRRRNYRDDQTSKKDKKSQKKRDKRQVAPNNVVGTRFTVHCTQRGQVEDDKLTLCGIFAFGQIEFELECYDFSFMLDLATSSGRLFPQVAE